MLADQPNFTLKYNIEVRIRIIHVVEIVLGLLLLDFANSKQANPDNPFDLLKEGVRLLQYLGCLF